MRWSPKMEILKPSRGHYPASRCQGDRCLRGVGKCLLKSSVFDVYNYLRVVSLMYIITEISANILHSFTDEQSVNL